MLIPLTQSKFTPVGWKDYKYFTQWKWCFKRNRKGEGGYAVRAVWINGKCKTILMHRVILERIGYKNFAKSDHINGDKLDNRRCNLRPATNQQSGCNRSKQKNNTSGYIGVCWDKQRKKWMAQIKVNRKHIHLGRHDDIEDAARAYNKAAIKYHGKFARLNVL